MQPSTLPKTITDDHETLGRFSHISDELLNTSFVEHLDDTSLLLFMQTSRGMRARLIQDDDGWLNRLTLLSSLYPGVAYLERGLDEEAFFWYWRLRRALASAETMARLHREGMRPYMLMHGTFADGIFRPCSPLRLPAQQGLIAEVMSYAAIRGMKDPAKDAALMFINAPPNADGNFRAIQKSISLLVQRERHLPQLQVALEKVYLPQLLVAEEPVGSGAASSSAVQLASSSAVQLESTSTVNEAQREARERVVRTLRVRVSRLNGELARAHDRIVDLELENAQLQEENAGLRMENRALRAEVSKQKGVVRELERELSERPKREELHTVRTKLTAERALRKTAEVKLRTFNLEKARLVKRLRAAEADFESAEEALAKSQPAADFERELIAMSERELERNCAAQVAAAHHSALAAIEEILEC
jgi:hypothetical protein